VWTDSRDAARHAILTRRGLGKAVLTEGLRRLKRMGVVVAFVGGSSLPANALYASVMGKELDLSETWIKEW